MACCGGSGPRQSPRRQEIGEKQPADKQPVVQRVIRNNQTAKAASVNRQYRIPRETCTKCGYPMIVVNIAGRERHQCSNVNCREIA